MPLGRSSLLNCYTEAQTMALRYRVHRALNGVTQSLVVVKTTKSRVFGAFTSIPMSFKSKSEQVPREDTTAFMFSQDHLSILRPNPQAKPPFAVTLSPSVMLWYGAGFHDLYIRESCNEHTNRSSIQLWASIRDLIRVYYTTLSLKCSSLTRSTTALKHT